MIPLSSFRVPILRHRIFAALCASWAVGCPPKAEICHYREALPEDRITYRLDAQGRTSTVEVDADSDGTLDRRETWVWDELGGYIVDLDRDLDGQIDERRTLEVNAAGQAIVFESSAPAQNALNWRFSFSYDAEGMLVGYTLTGPNDVVQEVATYSWPSATERRVEVADLEGTPLRSSVWLYDGEGRVIEALQEDFARDPPRRVKTVYTYEDGGRVTVAYDSDADGTTDSREVIVRNERGVPTLEELDHDADGQPDMRTTYAYDEAGNLVAKEIDYDVDGGVDVRDEWTRSTSEIVRQTTKYSDEVTFDRSLCASPAP